MANSARKSFVIRVPAPQHKFAESLAPALTLASAFLLVYFPLFQHLMRQLAAETWFPDLSAFGVFGRSRHRALAHLGGGKACVTLGLGLGLWFVPYSRFGARVVLCESTLQAARLSFSP